MKPENSNIAAIHIDQFVFEEVQIISVRIGDDNFNKNKIKIAELIQKFIPYQILLCIYNSDYFVLNTCDKRINLNDSARRTVEKHYFSENINIKLPEKSHKSFMSSLSFAALDKNDLRTFYQSCTDRIIALQASGITGTFAIRNNERSKKDVLCIDNIARLNTEIAVLLKKAKKETQLNIQVQINNSVQQKRKEIKKLEKTLMS